MGVLINNPNLELWLSEYTNRVKQLVQDEGKNPSDKKDVAKAMYHGLKHAYGFQESLETGVYAPTPDELNQTNCASQMLVNYLIAREFGLNPKIVEVDGLRALGSNSRLSHAFIEVDIGEEHPWTIDQTMLLLGPIRWDLNNKKLVINNCATDEKYKIEQGDEVFFYTIVDRYDEQEYEHRLRYQRSIEGAAGALIAGQKVGCFEINKWKMQKPTMSTWYLKFNSEERVIESLLTFPRPLIQNRGLINRLYLDLDGNIEREELTGYFYAEDGFRELLGETPMFFLFIDKAMNLSKDLYNLSLDQQYDLEDRVQAFCLGELEDDKQIKLIVEASKESLRELITRDRLRSDARWKFILTEALYQHKRRQVGKELAYSARDRTIAFEQLQDVNEKAYHALKLIKDYERQKRFIKKFDTRFSDWTRRVLDPRRREKAEVERYMRIRDEREMLLYQMESSMKTVEEAGDRIAFVHFDLKDHLKSLETLGEEAERRMGDDMDKWFDAAYARIFVEFLGNTAASMFQLRFLRYRESILYHIENYRHPLFKIVSTKLTPEQQRQGRLESLIKFLKKAKEALAS